MIEILHQGEKVRYTQFAAFCHIDRKLNLPVHIIRTKNLPILVIEMMAISFLHTFLPSQAQYFLHY